MLTRVFNLLKPRGFSLVFNFCLVISKHTSTFALYIINWLVFITVVECVYCSVRTDSLYTADYVSYLKGYYVMHGMKNKSSMGLLWMWQWSTILWDMTFPHRCWWRKRPVNWWRVMDVSVECSALILALKMKVNWSVAVRISQPQTVVPKRRQETTDRCCVKSLTSADLIYTAFEAWNHATVKVLCILLSACHRNAQTEVGRVFSLLCCSRVCWSFQI